MIKGVLISSLEIVNTPGGSVMHAIKISDKGYVNFGEAYFSHINFGVIKAWKRHERMTLNLIVPVGGIQFVLFDDRENSGQRFQKISISKDNYCRLTVPPMVWVGFKGLSRGGSMLLNIADIEHDPLEVNRKNIEEIKFDWGN